MTTAKNTVGHGLELSIVDKTEVKITVRWQKHFQYWLVWSRQNKIDKNWAKAMEKGKNASSWWISEKIIPLESVVRIGNTITGEVYYCEKEQAV